MKEHPFLNRISRELSRHIPFTLLGAMTGIVLMFFTHNMPEAQAEKIFYILHPMHVVLSALVTASMYKMYKCGKFGEKCSVWSILLIGCVGSIGIATLSDSVIPYLGETLLDLPNRKPHLGFVEEWWLILPAAVIGVAIAYFRPQTKFSHAGHVLLSTWASLFHVIMALGKNVNVFLYFGVFIFLFLSVWLPCCISDIVFPLLFVKNGDKAPTCHYSH